MKKLPFLPPPSKPRKHGTVKRSVRAERLRRWLVYGPQTRDELTYAMQCTRYQLYHTLKTMPDIVERDGLLSLATPEESSAVHDDARAVA